jgi:SAM-dependent methyltransferase
MVEPSEILRANIANYNSHWSAEEYTRENGLRPQEEALIAEFFPPPPVRVLDLGCGAGRTTAGLARLGYDVVAIDLSDQLLELARSRFPGLDFRNMDATALDFPDGSFAAALFSYNGIDDIHPKSGRLRCMSEVHRVLRPAGSFLLSSHNFIGSIFSGGFFYPIGYWNAAKRIAAQWANPLALEWYIKYCEGGGRQYVYSAPPGATVRQLRKTGFDVPLVLGVGGEKDPWKVFFHQQHVDFAAIKRTGA